uniref:Uncharacterized protein n=1 Tax=Anopheles coluzzii TaxID=1518534 RepID=A0A6E8W4K1_ANOCL
SCSIPQRHERVVVPSCWPAEATSANAEQQSAPVLESAGGSHDNGRETSHTCVSTARVGISGHAEHVQLKLRHRSKRSSLLVDVSC